MTIKECIDIVDDLKPNQYSTKVKVMWLSFIDEIIINDVLKTHKGYDGRYDDFTGYSEDKLSVPLIVASPYDRLYTAYLKMKIDAENGETARYNNSAGLFNSYMMEYRKFYNKTHIPLNMADKEKANCKATKLDVTEAQLEFLKRELYPILAEDINKAVSDDKIYDIVMNYVNNNIELLTGGLKTSKGTVVSQNADFAEVAEWADGNPNNEDRTGYFVCANVPVDGIVMKKATSIDDVKGVSILAPAFAGNYTKDKVDSNGNLLPKYSYVAIIGFVPVIDNGTCTVGGRCMPDDNGCAVPSINSMGYQVVNRIDEKRVLIIIEPNGDMVQRIKTKINQLQDDIDNLPVDQTYNPESENPQSGKAVAEATQEIKDVLDFEHKTVNIIENLSNTFVYLATSQGGNSTASSAWIAYTIKTSQIPEFNKIMVSTYGGDLNKYQVAFYSDANTQNSGTFISGIAFSGNDEKETVTITELPENTQSIIITNRKTSGTDMSVILETKEFTTLLDELSEDVSTIVAELDSKYVITDLIPLSAKTFYYVPSNNTMTASSSWESYAISVADIPEFSEIEVSSHTSANNYKQIAFYSTPTPSNDSYISGIEFGSINGKITHTITELPEDTLSILVTNRKASGTITFTSTSKEKASNVGITLNRVVDIEEHILKEQRARFDNSFNFISYSSMGVSEGDINTEEHYTWCAKQKFTSIKGDARVSSDGKIIMCHDAGFTLDDNGDVTAYDINNNIKIKTLTEAECFALKQAKRGHHICGLDSLIRVCKLYGKVPYITIRDGDMDIIIPEMFRILDIYNMRKRAIINSFTYETLEKVRRFDDDIALSWVMEYNHKVTEEDIDKADVLGNCLITCFDYSGASPTKSANQSDEIIQYAKSKDIRLYEACIGYQYDLNADEIYKRGFTGAQCEMLPDIIS